MGNGNGALEWQLGARKGIKNTLRLILKENWILFFINFLSILLMFWNIILWYWLDIVSCPLSCVFLSVSFLVSGEICYLMKTNFHVIFLIFLRISLLKMKIYQQFILIIVYFCLGRCWKLRFSIFLNLILINQR